MSHEQAGHNASRGTALDEPSLLIVWRLEMFKTINHKIARYILSVTTALIAAGVPVAQIVQAADCAGCSPTPG